MEGTFFQRYHGKENTHSSNAMMLLERLYYYSPTKFYDVISSLYDQSQAISERGSFLPEFITQDTRNGKGSIPDFAVCQSGFKLIVEAKEGGKFNEGQLKEHLKGLNDNKSACNKMLMALSPYEADQSMIDGLRKDFQDIHIIHRTYISVYDIIHEVMDPIRDYEFIDLLEDYKDYCEKEGLIDTSDNTIIVRSSGDTYDFNMANNIYYDKATNNAFGFRYLALYGGKAIKAIGKITKIIEADEVNGEIKCERKRFYTKDETVNDSDEKKIKEALKDRERRYGNLGIKHWHYIVDKFYEVGNFTKASKGGLFGKKKFYLKENFGLEPKKCSVEDIVEAMNKCETWENAKGN